MVKLNSDPSSFRPYKWLRKSISSFPHTMEDQIITLVGGMRAGSRMNQGSIRPKKEEMLQQWKENKCIFQVHNLGKLEVNPHNSQNEYHYTINSSNWNE